jgi:riboflavin transporter FmnP
MRKPTRNTAFVAYSAMMTAIAIILNHFPEIPVPLPFAPWLKLDFSFVPMLLLGFSLGPVAAVSALLVSNAIHLLSANTGGVGQLANVLMGLSYLLPPTLLYRKKRTLKTALIGMVIGILGMVIVGVLSNRYILIPAMLGDKAVTFNMTGYLIQAIIPFNLLKGTLNAVIVFVLYKRLSTLLKEVEKKCSN